MEKGRCLISTISFRHYRPLSMPHKKVHAIAVDRHPTFEVEIRSTAKSQHVPWPNSCVLLHMLYLDPAYVLSLLLLAGKIVAVGGVGVVCFGFEAFRFVT